MNYLSHLYLNLHKIPYSLGIVENTQNYLSVLYVLYYKRTQQLHKSSLNIERTATSTERALQLIDNAPVQRVRKLLEGPNGLKGLIDQSSKRSVTPALRAHTTARRCTDPQISVQLKHTLTSTKSYLIYGNTTKF